MLLSKLSKGYSPCTPNTPTAPSLPLPHPRSHSHFTGILLNENASERISSSASPGAGPSDPEQRPLSAQFLLQFSIHITFSAAFLSVNAHCGNDCDSYCNYVGKRGERAWAEWG